jgi:putative transcriptional regulator
VENNIYRLLSEKNITQVELAAGMGIWASNLHEIINGKRRPRIDIALKMSDVLRIPLNDIFYLTESDWK